MLTPWAPQATRRGATVITARARLQQAAVSAGWLALAVALSLVLLSVALSPTSNWTVRLALAGFCILAIVRPAAALLVTTALVGFGIILAHQAGLPLLRVTEVLVVASLAGCCVRAIAGGPYRRALTGWISVPIVLFATAAVASTLVWLRVQQVETAYPLPFTQSFLQFLGRHYFVQPGEFWLVVSAAVILQGLALYVVAAALCQVDRTFFERALRMFAIGGAALGLLSVVRLVEIVLRNPQAIEQLRATSDGLRISPQIPDYIAAGSYFALCWLITLGLAMASPRRWALWLAAGAPLMAAIYLTGSRSVIAAALVGLAVTLLIVVRQGTSMVRSVLPLALLAVVVMGVSYPWLTGRDVAGVMARQSVEVRIELARTSLRVIATRPLFGVGIDRYHLLAGSLASPRLNALFPVRKNPHNDFLRFGAELGLVGLGLFLWILAAAGRRIWRALQVTRDPRLAGLVGGLVAFLTTSLVSNPLMLREVSYVFWIALGLAVAQSAGSQPAPGAAEPAMRVPAQSPAGRNRSRWRPMIAMLIFGSLVLSLPFRARQEVSAVVDLRHVAYGFFDWITDEDGAPYRWSGPRATFFVDGRARLVEIPLRGALLPSGEPQEVEMRIDGRLADRITVGVEWQRLRTPLPPNPSTEPRRIDLRIVPSWVPAEIVPDNEDPRELGVRVGRIEVVLRPD